MQPVAPRSAEPRRESPTFAVLGSPVEHSLSPVIHTAAFEELGLHGWQYGRIDCAAADFAATVDALGPQWMGLSVTMPCKFAALQYASGATPRAHKVGSANTLIRTREGWYADCTDIDGVVGCLDALGYSGGKAVVIGAGGTSMPAVAALADRDCDEVLVVARSEARAGGTLACAERFGIPGRWAPLDPMALVSSLKSDAGNATEVVISTVPSTALTADIVAAISSAPRLLDVIYHPWPTPLAVAVAGAGGAVVGGRTMLLNQAYQQSTWFTGSPAPHSAMIAALDAL